MSETTYDAKTQDTDVDTVVGVHLHRTGLFALHEKNVYAILGAEFAAAPGAGVGAIKATPRLGRYSYRRPSEGQRGRPGGLMEGGLC